MGVPGNVRLSRKKPGSASNSILFIRNGSMNVSLCMKPSCPSFQKKSVKQPGIDWPEC